MLTLIITHKMGETVHNVNFTYRESKKERERRKKTTNFDFSREASILP